MNGIGLIKKRGNSLSKVETIVNSVNFESLLLHQSNVTNRNFIVFLTIYTCFGVLTLYIYMYQHLINHLLLFYNFIWCLIHTNIGKGTCRNETRISIRYIVQVINITSETIGFLLLLLLFTRVWFINF